MTVGNKLVAKVQKAFDSKDLKVAKDMEVEAQSAKFNKLNVGGNGQIKLVGMIEKMLHLVMMRIKILQ